ncbi:helix-turn-helix domain-containing protein [Kitasatospora kifunensis]|uniref:Transcriptional regulator with XRE-family HTH domain n=1 Tax=Kitasatospora kifunensis TaxID=58351 RepID=A0A7W7VYU8_KITKI|nr:helix-turn-helix domain-containing protein [Kitasatospora kifunensis]MBB4928092.1 transcriptional regulator with XRE-family HTH domain [Kitasatospora kifunensis]
MTTFGEMLLELRRAAGLTQEELAEAAGLAARSIRDLERGQRGRPQRRTAQLLVSALGLADADAAALLAAGRSGRRVVPPADDGVTESDLLDRRSQLAVLECAAGAARAGRGAVVLVRASAGMGKTSLVNVLDEGPLALVIDDVHWADLPSVRWLE